MKEAGLRFDVQVPISIVYKGHPLDCGYRADLIVADTLLVEVKSVQSLLRIHDAQTLTYLKISGLRQALLVNFNERRLVDGLRSLLNSTHREAVEGHEASGLIPPR